MATLEQCIANLQQLKKNLPTIVGNEMVNDAKAHIRKGTDIKGRAMTPRKSGAKRNTGRALLVDTGDGLRSIDFEVKGKKIMLIAKDYMIAHNEGVSATVTKRAHTRTRKGRSETVKSHSVKMNLPQREYAGDSSVLRTKINTTVGNLATKACR